MLYQSINNINTDKPLLAFVNRGDYKYGFITGTGIISSIGDNTKETLDSLVAERTGIKEKEYLVLLSNSDQYGLAGIKKGRCCDSNDLFNN